MDIGLMAMRLMVVSAGAAGITGEVITTWALAGADIMVGVVDMATTNSH
jgi:hypothetical protein